MAHSDPSPNPSAARQIFLARHPMTYQPTVADMQALRFIASAVAHRASSIVAVGIHALWELRNETERLAATDDTREHTIVAYNGSVMENYPGFRTMTQAQLDGLIEASGGRPGSVELMYAEESSLVGAAVSVACLDG
jgi:hexokinase